MARPTKPEDQRKVRVNVSLDKSVYKNAQNQRLNISRFCSSALQIYLSNGVQSSGSKVGPRGIEPRVFCTSSRRLTIRL